MARLKLGTIEFLELRTDAVGWLFPFLVVTNFTNMPFQHLTANIQHVGSCSGAARASCVDDYIRPCLGNAYILVM